jgi:hypothetical protein
MELSKTDKSYKSFQHLFPPVEKVKTQRFSKILEEDSWLKGL